MRLIKKFSKLLLQHRYGLTLCVFLLAAGVTGIACVWFMRLFELVFNHRLDFANVGRWYWLVTPLVFLCSVELIRRLAPCAAGTGIPQAIFAAQHFTPETETRLFPLVSPLTLVIKVIALLMAVWVGASTGREGPTVHIATCVFLLIFLPVRRWFGLQIDLRSAVVAGGAAGLAAAFNTPLAGVTFAIEELTSDYFSNIKDLVLVAIIFAAIAAKSLTGEYTYFGKLSDPSSIPLLTIIVIGIGGGVLGAIFSTAILKGQALLARHHQHRWGRYLIPILFSLGLLVVAVWSKSPVFGPGNLPAQELVHGQYPSWTRAFPLAKMAATLLTYLSGVAGGIFAPCLSIGAAIGANIGHGMGVSVASCALVGMAAFLSGTIQAPITSFVIIFEMTGHHQMLLPVMLASLLAFMTAHLLGAKHLYKNLAENYRGLLQPSLNQSER